MFFRLVVGLGALMLARCSEPTPLTSEARDESDAGPVCADIEYPSVAICGGAAPPLMIANDHPAVVELCQREMAFVVELTVVGTEFIECRLVHGFAYTEVEPPWLGVGSHQIQAVIGSSNMLRLQVRRSAIPTSAESGTIYLRWVPSFAHCSVPETLGISVTVAPG